MFRPCEDRLARVSPVAGSSMISNVVQNLAVPTYRLPPEAYYSREWFEMERRELFARTWNLVAYESDVPAGDGACLPVRVLDAPYLLTRDGDGVIRGFVNMCRHRGMVLAEAPTTCRTVRCEYHGWEYGLDGSLRRLPQRSSQFADVDTADWGLVPVACATWGGMIFVNPDGNASDLDVWLADLPQHMGPFPRTDLVEVFRGRFPIASNWKFYVENHIDCYHLWYLHDESLKMNDHHLLWQRNCGEHWTCGEPLRPGEETRDRGGVLPMPDLDAAEAALTRANLIFPNIPQTSGGHTFSTYQVLPLGPESSELDLRIWAMPGSTLSDEAIALTLAILVTEDGFACEQMQRAVRSPAFEVGPLALVHEQPISDLHAKLVRYFPSFTG